MAYIGVDPNRLVSLILYEYTATSGQTTFSGSDDNSATLSYTADNLQVVMNGIVLDPSDFTATNGTSVVLATGAATGSLVNIYAFKSFTVADTVSASSGGTFSGNVTVNALLNVDNIRIDGNTISSTNTNGDITLDPDGTGDTIVASGNVGIGTTSPTFGSGSGLEIERAGISTIRLDDSTDSTAIEIKAAVGAVAIDGRTNHPMLFATNGTERMRIESNGNWKYSGIASGAGTYPLKWNASTGAITFDTSARQVKDNIVDCSYGLSEILQLQPRQYNRNDDGDKLEIGFVADEVSSVMPEFVPLVAESVFSGDEADTALVAGGVNYEKLVAVLTKAIQEQNATITDLEARLTALENAS